MKKLRILMDILRQTKSDRIILSYFIFLLIDALIILLVEPNIHHYGDALWYCYEVISTTGFGEMFAVTLIGRICSVLLTVYSLLVIAIITGIITNYYIQLIQIRQKETLTSFMDQLENLPNLSKDELVELSEQVKEFRKDKKT